MAASDIGMVLLVACVVAIMSRRLHLPYSVGLVLAGFGLSRLGGAASLTLTPDLVTTVLLPPLIFEAALQMKWRPFSADLPLTLALAFPGTILSGGVVTVGMHAVLGWTWLGAALFGALIAATDPVSIIASFTAMRVEERLRLLVESESLLNDGAAAVAFAILTIAATGTGLQASAVGLACVWMILGGVTVGAGIACAVLLLAGRTDDHLVEITLTTIAAYASFLIANDLHMSGVLATLAAGLVVGNLGWRGSISGPGREHAVAFWEYVAFLANSVVFILIGGYEARGAATYLSGGAGVTILLVLAGRIVAVYPLCALFARSRLRVSARYQHILVWGGLRGALGLALALSVPQEVQERGAIIGAAFGVVAFSVFVQGISIPWMIRALRLRG